MSTQIILLRGVNVGKAKRVPMAELKALLLGLGCKTAQTLLNSGNAVVTIPRLSSAALAEKVEVAIEARFGFAVPVVVKSADELARIVAEGEAFAHDGVDPSRRLVAFGRDAAALASLHALEALVAPPERFRRGAHAAYLECPGGLLESRAASALLGAAGKAVTTRNWATVLKLQALASGSR